MPLPILEVALVEETNRYGDLIRHRRQNIYLDGTPLQPKSFDLDINTAFNLLLGQEELQESLSKLASYIKSTNSRPANPKAVAEATSALRKAQSSSDKIGQFLGRFKDLTPPHLRPPTPASTAKANEVFSSPELLEEILGYLNIPEKLDAMRVQKTWLNTFNGSVKLLRSLGLAPRNDLDKFYFSPFSDTFQVLQPGEGRWPMHFGQVSMPGGMYADWPNWPPGGWLNDRSPSYADCYHHGENPPEVDIVRDVTVTVNVSSGAGETIRLGSRVKSMAICSPPLRAMRVKHGCFQCKKHKNSDGKPGYKGFDDFYELTTEDELGVTVGLLSDTTNDLRAGHRECGEDRVVYEGVISMCDDDPLVVEQVRVAADKQQEWLRIEELVKERNAKRDGDGKSPEDWFGRYDRYGPDSFDEYGNFEDTWSEHGRPDHDERSRYSPWGGRSRDSGEGDDSRCDIDRDAPEEGLEPGFVLDYGEGTEECNQLEDEDAMTWGSEPLEEYRDRDAPDGGLYQQAILDYDD